MGPLVFRGFGKCVCVLVCFVLWHAVGYLEQHLLFYRSPLVKWYLAGCGLVVLGRSWLGVVCGGGVLCENCIVDANAIIINGNGNNDYCCCCLFFFFVVFVLGIFCCLCVIICLCFLF